MTLITNREREEYRDALGYMDYLGSTVEDGLIKGTPVDSNIRLVLSKMTDSDDPETQLRALRAVHSDLDKQYDEKLRYAAQFRFSPFCEFMVRTEPPAFHHEFLIEHMEMIHNREIMRLAISMPPGSAKSTYSSIRFAAWHLGRRPDDRWLQGAHTQTFAKDRLGKPVRGIMQDPRYRDVFPDMGISSSSSAADYFEFVEGKGYYKAVGVGVGIAGYRAEIAAIDDPLASREDAESPTIRRKLHDWFEDDFGTRPMPGSPMYVVATRWHEDDLIGYELNKMAEGRTEHDWTVINIPALAGPDDPLGRKEGEGLWPEVFGTAFYTAKKRASTSRSWNSLYQGVPTDEEGGVLARADIHRYKEVPEDQKSKTGAIIKKIVKRITLSVDAAEKANQRNDYSAATVWIETRDKKHYLIHANRDKIEFNDFVKWVDELARAFDVDQILIEDAGHGTQYIQLRKESKGPAPVIAQTTKNKTKEFRFDGVTPMFKTGQVLLPESGNDWIADLEQELLVFPNGRNDDYVDSVSQYLSYTRGGSVKRGTRKVHSGHA
jgi:predicted phage terminase large subunit-like protein